MQVLPLLNYNAVVFLHPSDQSEQNISLHLSYFRLDTLSAGFVISDLGVYVHVSYIIVWSLGGY